MTSVERGGVNSQDDVHHVENMSGGGRRRRRGGERELVADVGRALAGAQKASRPPLSPRTSISSASAGQPSGSEPAMGHVLTTRSGGKKRSEGRGNEGSGTKEIGNDRMTA